MLTTLFFLLGRDEKESLLFVFLADLVLLIVLTLLLGRMLVWLDVILLSALFTCVNIPIRRYDAWREKERTRLMHSLPDWRGYFPQKWVPYADFWSQLVGRGMVKVYIIALLLGKCSTYIF